MRARKDSKFQQIGERNLKLSKFKAKPLKEGDFEKSFVCGNFENLQI